MERGRILWIVLLGAGIHGCECPIYTGSTTQQAQKDVVQEVGERQKRWKRSSAVCAQGSEVYEAGDLKRARKLLKEAVETNDRNAIAWVALGVTELRLQHLYEAAAAFDRAAKLLPNRYEPHYNLGLVYEAAGRYDKAIGEYEMALAMNPEQLEVLENLARAYERTNTKLDKAKGLVVRALQQESRPEWRLWLEERKVQWNAMDSRQRTAEKSAISEETGHR